MLPASLISHLRCPIQLQRPEEVEGGGKTNNTLSLIEGQTEFTQTYVQSVETDIILDRKFTIPGYIYNLTLVSFNMHDVTAPNIIMRWRLYHCYHFQYKHYLEVAYSLRQPCCSN